MVSVERGYMSRLVVYQGEEVGKEEKQTLGQKMLQIK
jgi:hypothetical protein